VAPPNRLEFWESGSITLAVGVSAAQLKSWWWISLKLIGVEHALRRAHRKDQSDARFSA
jgi:hypothetical protein